MKLYKIIVIQPDEIYLVIEDKRLLINGLDTIIVAIGSKSQSTTAWKVKCLNCFSESFLGSSFISSNLIVYKNEITKIIEENDFKMNRRFSRMKHPLIILFLIVGFMRGVKPQNGLLDLQIWVNRIPFFMRGKFFYGLHAPRVVVVWGSRHIPNQLHSNIPIHSL